ncbi:hypothetical protein PXJ67_11880 [Mycobacteroides chelonae]|uniref:hypothetical protein n=1 Tax=Mycobacteroides chelonae TaxID=1774 RepID=UPI00095A7C26|nr:hypothetical protein [Mycobacteroides chelonae]OLT84040.1 hypothetical protein BKG57_04065 [Mycobacteroides chelonae]WED94033.1 hypothetical protein PXJ67_11880 [Mycobacteroides chelonae]WED98144.1 hypothetical protein PYW02_06575 [Mycobacteroides chelonae]
MWVSWLIALAALVLGAYYFWSNNRRKTLELDVNLTPLLASKVESRDELEVRFNGLVIRDPIVVDFHIANTGQKDIASKDFDADKPLRVAFNSTIVSQLEVSDAENAPMLTIGSDSRSLLIVPHKIAAGHRYQTRVLVDGQVRLKVADDPLIDTNVVIGDYQRLKELKRLVAVMGVSMSLVFLDLAGFLWMLVNRDRIEVRNIWLLGRVPSSPTWAAWVMYSSPVVVAILVVAILYVVTRLRRIRADLDRIAGKDRR